MDNICPTSKFNLFNDKLVFSDFVIDVINECLRDNVLTELSKNPCK